MKCDLTGKVALVTGAAQGIAQAIALQLKACGAEVQVADIDGDRAGSFAREHGLACHIFDIADRHAAQGAVAEALKRTGGRLHILVNGAGGVRGQVGRPIESITEADWSAVFDANIHGAFWMAQACAPAMQSAGWGRMIHITSGAGLRPSLTGIQAYTAAKMSKSDCKVEADRVAATAAASLAAGQACIAVQIAYRAQEDAAPKRNRGLLGLLCCLSRPRQSLRQRDLARAAAARTADFLAAAAARAEARH